MTAAKTSTDVTPRPKAPASKSTTKRAPRKTTAKAATPRKSAPKKAPTTMAKPAPKSTAPEAIDASTADGRIARTAAAEDKALKAWVKAGEQGERPATPNLDAVNEQYSNGGANAAKKATAGPGRPAREVKVRFTVDGKPMGDSVNKLHEVAFSHTKNEDGSKMTSKELRDALAAAGITEPESTVFEFKLPNGKVLTTTML